jgi:hypothetical protein
VTARQSRSRCQSESRLDDERVTVDSDSDGMIACRGVWAEKHETRSTETFPGNLKLSSRKWQAASNGRVTVT